MMYISQSPYQEEICNLCPALAKGLNCLLIFIHKYICTYKTRRKQDENNKQTRANSICF